MERNMSSCRPISPLVIRPRSKSAPCFLIHLELDRIELEQSFKNSNWQVVNENTSLFKCNRLKEQVDFARLIASLGFEFDRSYRCTKTRGDKSWLMNRGFIQLILRRTPSMRNRSADSIFFSLDYQNQMGRQTHWVFEPSIQAPDCDENRVDEYRSNLWWMIIVLLFISFRSSSLQSLAYDANSSPRKIIIYYWQIRLGRLVIWLLLLLLLLL